MKGIFKDCLNFYTECKQQDFGFYMVAAYLVFSYLRPQVLFPILNIIPWTELTIVSGILYSIVKNRLKFQHVHFSLFLFCMIALISSYLSYYPDKSFNKLNVIFIWTTEVLFFTNCIRTTKQYKLITILFFLLIFKMSFFGARTWIERGFGFRGWGIAGPTGFFANSGEFSLLIAMLAAMSIAFILGHKKVNKMYYLLPLTAIMTVAGASSRGGQLALAGAMFVIAVVIGKLRIKNILLVTFMSLAVFSLLPDQQINRFSTAGDDDTSESRLIYWGAGLEMMNEHKWFGVGYYTFPQYFHDHYSMLFNESIINSGREEVAHNSLIEVGSTMGYVGLTCYLWLIYLVYSLNRKTRKILRKEQKDISTDWMPRYSIGLDAALVAYLIGSFFMSVAFYPYLYLLLMLSQSLNNCSRRLLS